MLAVLHLFANHKVTGPAELALETARAVARAGASVRFLSSDVGKTRYRDRWLQLLARERGLEEPPLSLRLAKHLGPISAFFDTRKLASYLSSHETRIVHAHLPNDHLLAAWAVARATRKVAIVRTVYDGEPLATSWRARRTLGTSQAIICLSKNVADSLREDASRFDIAEPRRVHFLEPPIDAVRFDPARPVPPKRPALGLREDAFVLGIVARMQTHRRYEVLLEAVKRARLEVPSLVLLVVGRGTNQDTVAREPVRALGLEGSVVFAGYQAGEDYVGTLAAMDAKVFLVPGSDGTCRAVREALAMGVPVIAARRGILPELVRDGQTGAIVDDEPEPLARAIVSLAKETARRKELGLAARKDAVERFSFESFGRDVMKIYETV